MANGKYFCKHCGTQIKGVYTFCPNCGSPLDADRLQEIFGDGDQDGETDSAVIGTGENNSDMNSSGHIPGDGSTWDSWSTGNANLRDTSEETVHIHANDSTRPDSGSAADSFQWKDFPFSENDEQVSYSYSQPKTEKKSRSGRVAGFIAVLAGGCIVLIAALYFLGVIGVKNADIFNGVSLKYTGIAPHAKAEVVLDNESRAQSKLKYVADKSSDISEGDSITVYALDSTTASKLGDSWKKGDLNEDEIASRIRRECHINPLKVKKVFKAKNLSGYLTTADDLTESVLEKIGDAASEQISDETKGWDNAQVSGTQYVGTYFLTPEGETDSDGFNNILYYTERVDVSLANGDSFSYYDYLRYTDLISDTEGNVDLDAADYEVADNMDSVEDGSYTVSFHGYKTLKDLYNGEIAGQDGYDVENHVTDSPKQDYLTAGGDNSTDVSSYGMNSGTTGSSGLSQTGSDYGSGSSAYSPASPLGGHSTVDGQIFPDSSTTLLTDGEVSALTRDQAQDAINEIYARNGYIFSKIPSLNDYYGQFSWYVGTTKTLTESDFNSVEIENMHALEKQR